VSSHDRFDPDKFSEDLHDRIHRKMHRRMQERMRDPQAAAGATMRTRVLPGLILVIIGTVFLLDHMGILQINHLWKYWPVILIVVGAMQFLESRNRMGGVLLMLVGCAFLLGTLGYLRLTMADLWPVILIAIGLGLIWSRFQVPNLAIPSAPGGPDKVNAIAMFGGVERRISTQNLTGGTVQAIFGGVELDFRSADIAGEETSLYVEAVFGGIELVVPERWMVIYEGQSIFGGYNDETRPPLPDVPGGAARKRLILRGQALFGGITVKN
jgi:predicted membrane protein